MIGCGQGSTTHLEGDVAVHTGLVLDNIKQTSITRTGEPPTFVQLLSAVLHDCRKPATRVVDEDGAVRFPGHEAAAASEICEISQRIGLMASEAEELHFLVAQHGNAHGWLELNDNIRNEIRASPWIIGLALLQEADAKSCLIME
jgi:hypothetical protein